MPAMIILNPYANRWKAGRFTAQVKSLLTELGYDFELAQTRVPGEAIGLAAAAAKAGYDPIVAAGGDGTISEVVNGLLRVEAAARPRLGLLPLGSANDYAFQLGIPLTLEGACRTLAAAAHERTLDAGLINDHYFMNDIAIAFGARVNIEAATIKRLRGSLIYLGGVFKALMRYHLPTVTFEWDGGRLENKPILLAYVGNGWRTGGVFFLSPHARLDDGRFDLLVGDALNRWQILKLLPKTFSGNHIHDPAAHMYSCTWLRIHSDDPLPVLADGEIIYRDCHDLEIRLLPAALRVISGPAEGQRPPVKPG
ncbi:MAG: diacylglycerol kinase family lipid kinase [Caldilineales bacterium]|nr:diacylglycerol kinase family lipid kinase [Caldilineales bacterium]